ncbi:MAG TPA: M1 family aminopeptidase [Gemmatimonadaceae bacterium]|nr:M1 family aminopeptidase [Gemmatimonadaceae bacterium]
MTGGRGGVFAALILAITSGLAGRSSAQEIRPYRPAFDVQDYVIAIDVPDSGSTIHAVATITVERRAPSDTLILDLLDLHVSRVKVNGQVVRFRQGPDSLAVPLPRTRSVSATFNVAVEYGGVLRDGLIAHRDDAGRWTYFGDNWPNRARHWIPSIDHPSDKATVTWRVRAKPSQTVIANGRLLARRTVVRSDGTRVTEWTWRESRRIPVYLMVIGVAPLEVYDLGDTACGLAELQRCVAQSVYVAPEQHDFLPGPFVHAREIVQLFSRLVGPFPYEKLAHVQSSTRFGGMENASEIFYADDGFRRGTMGDDVIAHETAHQWFGDAVTEREWPHLWLSEGFATYFAALWDRADRGESAFRTRMDVIRRTILSDTAAVPRRPVIDTIETNLLALLNRNSYEKGGFVLHMLRVQVGDSAFFHALRSYYAKHRHGTALSDDLRSEMERASGQQLGWFFDQWLKRPGYPDLTATWHYDATAKEATITVDQGGPFGAFRVPLTIAATDSTGAEHRATIALSAVPDAVAQLRIPLQSAPTAIVLDPDVELLARLRVVRQ